MRRAALVALLVLAACSGGDDGPAPLGNARLKQSFAPETTTTTTGAGPATPTTTPGSTERAASPTTTTAAPTARTESTVTDRAGDVVGGVERAPKWADLVGGRLVATGSDVELRIRMGDRVPSNGDGTHTLNAALYADVDGDGRIDYEVWANLAAGGWGGAWYDNVRGSARFTDESGVQIATAGDELVLTFERALLGGATTFRWGLGTEWSRYETLGTIASSRDEAPEGQESVRHPS